MLKFISRFNRRRRPSILKFLLWFDEDTDGAR